MTLRIDWPNRHEAAEWANEIVLRVNQEMRERAIKKADASMGYLEKELEATSTVATRDAISRLMESQVKQRMLANVTQEYAFRIVDRAMPADEDDPVRPPKLAMILGGPFVGLVLAILCILIIDAFRHVRESGRGDLR